MESKTAKKTEIRRRKATRRDRRIAVRVTGDVYDMLKKRTGPYKPMSQVVVEALLQYLNITQPGA